MTRVEQLVQAAATALERGETPLSDHWLRENTVTAQEAFDVAQSMATILTAYLKSPPEIRAGLLLCRVTGENPEHTQRTHDFLQARRVLRQMQEGKA